MSDLDAILDEIEAYLDERSDAEYFTDSPVPIPNEEMHLLSRLRDARSAH